MAQRKTMTVLVTGATGFLGGRVAERLVMEQEATVRVLLRAVGRASRIASLPVGYHLGDVTDVAEVRAAAEGCDVVIHCASQIEGGVAAKQTTTFAGTAAVAQACAELGVPMVHVSSSAVYGVPDGEVVDERAPQRPRHAHDVYAIAKIEAERAVRSLCQTRGLRAAMLQPTMIYGPYSGEWTLTPLAMLAAADVAMPEGDASVCNAVYVDDVVSAILLAIDKCSTACPAWVINGGELPSWTEFLARHAALGTAGRVVPVPMAEIERLRGGGGQDRSLIRTSLRLVREQPDFRAALLSTWAIGGLFSLAQKTIPKPAFAALKARIRGYGSAGVAVTRFPEPPPLPLELPPAHFIDLAGQRYRFSNDKAGADLGYAPRFGLDAAFALIGDWARWSRMAS